MVDETDLRRFVGLVPGWSELSRGLRCLVLAGEWGADGWYSEGVIGLNGFSVELAETWSTEAHQEHEAVLERLMVPCEPVRDGILCRFDRTTARGFQLMHVFLHELGHHVDCMGTKLKRDSPRGEPFAETFANDLAARMWTPFFRAFKM